MCFIPRLPSEMLAFAYSPEQAAACPKERTLRCVSLKPRMETLAQVLGSVPEMQFSYIETCRCCNWGWVRSKKKRRSRWKRRGKWKRRRGRKRRRRWWGSSCCQFYNPSETNSGLSQIEHNTQAGRLAFVNLNHHIIFFFFVRLLYLFILLFLSFHFFSYYYYCCYYYFWQLTACLSLEVRTCSFFSIRSQLISHCCSRLKDLNSK